jgi:hypothetical protein
MVVGAWGEGFVGSWRGLVLGRETMRGLGDGRKCLVGGREGNEQRGKKVVMESIVR